MTTATLSTMLPARYKTLGAKRGWDPTPADKLRMFLVGPPGSGKSTFVASNPRAFILDTEGRTNDVVDCKATYFPLTSVPAYIEVVRALVEDGKAGKPPCSTVVLDTADAFVSQLIPYLSETICGGQDIRQLPHGKGYGIIVDWVCSRVRDLALAGYGICLISHLKESAVVNEQGEITRFKLEANIFPSMLAQFHMISHIQGTFLRKIIRPTSVKIIKRSGKSDLTVESTGEPVNTFTLSLRPGDGKLSGERADAKNPYLGYLKEHLEIPAKDGWAYWTLAYNEAMDRIKQDRDAASA